MRLLWRRSRLPRWPFLSTHPVRDATAKVLAGANIVPISIHASREGCDRSCLRGFRAVKLFLSTHPVRDATHEMVHLYCIANISIHASREGCDFAAAEIAAINIISIHASREGCDLGSIILKLISCDFYPRIP